jgi:hypothetical protein
MGGGMVNTNGGGMGTGMSGGGGMPAFNQSAAAGLLPGIMNFMQNVMPHKRQYLQPQYGNKHRR